MLYKVDIRIARESRVGCVALATSTRLDGFESLRVNSCKLPVPRQTNLNPQWTDLVLSKRSSGDFLLVWPRTLSLKLLSSVYSSDILRGMYA